MREENASVVKEDCHAQEPTAMFLHLLGIDDDGGFTPNTFPWTALT